jgi:hypothetical protein
MATAPQYHKEMRSNSTSPNAALNKRGRPSQLPLKELSNSSQSHLYLQMASQGGPAPNILATDTANVRALQDESHFTQVSSASEGNPVPQDREAILRSKALRLIELDPILLTSKEIKMTRCWRDYFTLQNEVNAASSIRKWHQDKFKTLIMQHRQITKEKDEVQHLLKQSLKQQRELERQRDALKSLLGILPEEPTSGPHEPRHVDNSKKIPKPQHHN